MSTKVVQLDELAKELGLNIKSRLTDYRAAVVRACLQSLPDLVEASPVDTGLYAQSWMVQEGTDSVMLGNTAPHASIIEYGARPFTPPIGPLLAWAKRVLKDGSQPPHYSAQVWTLAKGTQKKIAVYGMAPKHVLENTIPVIMKRIEEELKKVG